MRGKHPVEGESPEWNESYERERILRASEKLARRRGDMRRRAARSDVRLHHYEVEDSQTLARSASVLLAAEGDESLRNSEHLPANFATGEVHAVNVEIGLSSHQRLQEILPGPDPLICAYHQVRRGG